METIHPVDIGIRINAISGLARTGKPGDVDTLSHIMEDPKEDCRVRSVAAIGLGQIPGPKTEQVLTQGLAIEDDLVRIRTVQALGRIGGPGALQALDQLPSPATEPEAKAVRLAKVLIVFRHDLEIDEPAFIPGRVDMAVKESDTMPVTVRRVRSKRLPWCGMPWRGRIRHPCAREIRLRDSLRSCELGYDAQHPGE